MESMKHLAGQKHGERTHGTKNSTWATLIRFNQSWVMSHIIVRYGTSNMSTNTMIQCIILPWHTPVLRASWWRLWRSASPNRLEMLKSIGLQCLWWGHVAADWWLTAMGKVQLPGSDRVAHGTGSEWTHWSYMGVRRCWNNHNYIIYHH